ncbi:hypothetical protein L7F22_058821 [Adiantum nelumboides]|nr:hypothetical protein [Adiantum nelumboides]
MKWVSRFKDKVGLQQTQAGLSGRDQFANSANGSFKSRTDHESELDFKRFWEEFRSSASDKRPTGTMVRALRDSMGQLHTCPDEILEMASVYYETLFTLDLLTGDVLDARDEVWSFVRPVVSGDMQTSIMRPFSLQEVTDAVHGLDGASCP